MIETWRRSHQAINRIVVDNYTAASSHPTPHLSPSWPRGINSPDLFQCLESRAGHTTTGLWSTRAFQENNSDSWVLQKPNYDCRAFSQSDPMFQAINLNMTILTAIVNSLISALQSSPFLLKCSGGPASSCEPCWGHLLPLSWVIVPCHGARASDKFFTSRFS
jgi:hypothetical protein